jgi:hypothetical protein
MPTLDQLQTMNQFGPALNATSNTTTRTTGSQSTDKALGPAKKQIPGVTAVPQKILKK